MSRLFYGFNKESGKFQHPFKEESGQWVIREYDTFSEFYESVDKNLHGSDLIDYDFKDVDVSSIDLDGVKVSSKFQKSIGSYDSTFFDTISSSSSDELTDSIALIPDYQNALADPIRFVDSIHKHSIFYITDIHLDQKLKLKFNESCNEYEIRRYIASIVDNFSQDYKDYEHYDSYFLIGGDVSSNLNIVRIFFEEMIKSFDPKKIIYVLGNHELWATHHSRKVSYNLVVNEYHKLASDLDIVLLENELLIVKDGRQVYSCKNVLAATDCEVVEEADKASLIVLGGIGFAPNNPDYNASKGQYGRTITDSEEERKLSSDFESFYLKLRSSISHMNVIVLSHMPLHDWSCTDFCARWYYVSGHNHQNFMEVNANHSVYSDNQIGYADYPMHLKKFDLYRAYDIFSFYEDGVYEISPQQYRDFYRNIGVTMRYNRSFGIKMIKRVGYYMFFMINDCGQCYLLNGGSPNCVSITDLQYYYNEIPKYANKVNNLLTQFNEALNSISEDVISFGGSGRIHGCIVDIDFFNHLYLNPSDGSITPYYATDIVNKLVYPSVHALLKDQCPNLLTGYISQEKLTINRDDHPILFDDKEGKPLVYTETDIYRNSRTILKFQYLTGNHIIRTWDPNLIDDDVPISYFINLLSGGDRIDERS